MKLRNTLLLVCVLSCLTHLINAQEFVQNIKGQVIDKQSGIHLPGVVVQLLSGDSSLISVSDQDGYYKLQDVPVGRVGVLFNYMGYDDVIRKNLILTTGKEYILNVEMEESITEVDEVKIEIQKNTLESNNKSVVASNVKLNPEQTQKFAGTFQDVSRMAANYAGVVPAGDQRNDIIVRGNSPSGIIWRLDGVNIPNPNHFGSMGTTGGPVSILNNNNLSSSDFLTGAFPSEYGNGVAGAFDLKMRSGNNEKTEFTGQIGFNGIEVGLEGPFKKDHKASYMVNYRYSTLGIFDAMGISFGVPAVPQYQDMTFKVDIPTKGKLGRFQLFGIGGLSYIELLDSEKEEGDWTYSSSGTDVRFKSNLGVLGLNHKYFLSNRTYLSNTVSITATENVVTSDTLESTTLAPFNTYKNNSLQKNYSLNSTINTKFNSKSTLKNGIIVDFMGVQFNESFYSNENTEWRPIVEFNGFTSLVQAYSQWQYKFSKTFVLNTGIHYQNLTLNNSQAIEPRIGMKYKMTPKQSFSFASGLHSQIQPLRVYLLETHLDDGSSLKTNEDLGLSKSSHFVLGYEYQLNQDFRVKAEAYYQYIYNTPVLRDSYYSLANTGADFVFNDVDSLINEGTGTNAGFEFTIEKMFSNGYYFLVNTSIYDSKYKGGDGVERNTAFNGAYTLNALAGYEIRFNEKATLTIDGKLGMAGGKRYQRIDIEESTIQNKAVFDESSIFELKFDDYMRVDMKIGFRFNSKKLTQEWAFDVQNLTNKKNIFREVYDPGSQEIKYEYQIGFFPVGLYKITF